ncbi:NIPSNAP family protein [Chitinophagaceae bacterium 26-R-25]|nr:NIPSNAP family protein [Chitinophagaceae bacterium 26-R-25]
MNWRLFCSCSGVLLVITTFFLLSWSSEKKPEQGFYQLTIYHFNTADQEKVIDKYLQDALLPALHKAGLKNIGIFKNHGNDTLADKTMYVLVPIKSIDVSATLTEKLDADKEYLAAGAEYLNATYSAPPYQRMEKILLKAFPLAPVLQTPKLKGARNERVYELRSYEGATEKLYKNKVQMFNEGDEVGLFKRLNFNSIFYGEVISGSKMPNLMYMTSFENKSDRDIHWKIFGDDPYWKKLVAMPEYQHNVSHVDISFLYPTGYSDF